MGEGAPAAEQKQAIRLETWSRLDREEISTFPRPAKGRIPNVRGADAAAARLAPEAAVVAAK